MSLAYPPSLSVPFGRDAIAPYIRVVPIASQISVKPGAASWETGFVPLNMTLKTGGGIAPFGSDMNGVLSYITQNLVWLCAGGAFEFNTDIVTAWTGYPEGAILRSAVDPSRYFYNTLADNANDPDDPDSVLTGWVAFSPVSAPTALQTEAPVAGTYDDFALDNGVGFLDIDTAAGDVFITGFEVDNVLDGQIVVVTNTGANLLTLPALNGGSGVENQFRFPFDLSYSANDGGAVRYSAAIGKWIRM